MPTEGPVSVGIGKDRFVNRRYPSPGGMFLAGRSDIQTPLLPYTS
jgi:hypothetical protein